MRNPKRFGPEWWAAYAAAFVHNFEKSAAIVGFDRAAELRSSSSERAAEIANHAIAGFADAVEGGCIEEG